MSAKETNRVLARVNARLLSQKELDQVAGKTFTL